ncbi:MAG: hypothetical protein LBP53_05005 [Candidatus Peribacteria bacterium]|nr:hypothetical protein [Candidatus Peribacteria bacterium]
MVELTDNQGNKKTGKLTETLDPTLKNPYPPEVQQKIDTEGEDNLRFLVDEQGNPLAAYTDEELKQHTLNVKDKKLQLAGEDLQRFVGQVLTMQVGGFESHSDKSEKKIAKFLDNMPKPATDVPVEEAETQRANFLTYFQDMKGHPFGYDKLKDNQHNVDNQKLSLEEIKKREEEA